MKKVLSLLKAFYVRLFNRILKPVLVVLLLLIVAFGSANAQEKKKLAPAFEYLLNHPITPENRASYPSLFKAAVMKGVNKKTGRSEDGYMCIIYTESPERLESKGIEVQSKLPHYVTAWVTGDQLKEMLNWEEVIYIDAPTVVYPNNDVSVGTSGASLLHAGKLRNTVYKGTGVIVGIFDSGIDWDHPDFRNPANQTQSRILRMWDQTLSPLVGAEVNPAGFNYGAEYTQAHINNEIDGTPAGFVREVDNNGHGTHVAGTAAGNGAAGLGGKYTGMAPDADLVIVKGGDNSFPSSNVIDALTYFQNVATAFGKPIVVNMSIGGHASAHDGTDPQEIAVDNFIASGPGRSVVIAAGNDNGSNIHRQLSIAASPGSGSSTLSVPAPSGTTSLDVFQITFYVNDASTVNCTVTAPGGTTATATAGNNSSTAVMGGIATVHLSNGIDAGSGDRMINIYVVRSTTSSNPSGTWTIALNNTSANALTVHGWLNYKGNDFGGITLTSGDNNNLVATPGCATNAITVGSYMGRLEWQSTAGATLQYSSGGQDDISTFSSRGPRRDGVQKPNITGNGQGVISALSSNSGVPNSDNNVVFNNFYRVNQGTSMASPEVAGAVALLYQVKSGATNSDVKNAIQNNARKDAFTTAVSNNTWGNGKLDIYKAATSVASCAVQNIAILSYDSSTTAANQQGVNLNAFTAAMRFTPTFTGSLGGVLFETFVSLSLTGNLTVEIRNNSAGLPGTLINSIAIPPANVAKLSWNYVDLTSLNIAVTSGTDYFICLVPAAGSTFTMAYEGLSTSGRCYYNNGAWTAFNDMRIRTIIYTNSGTTSPNFTLTSGSGTNVQTRCAGSAISNITWATTGATGATFTGLPTGITGSWAANVATITGSSSIAGTYNYTVTATGGSCGAASATGTITILAAPTATAGAALNACQSASPSAITLSGSSVGGSATTGAWSIISGGGTLSTTAQTATPQTVTYTPAANFTGTVTLRLTSNSSGGCVAATSDRTINVNATPTATAGAALNGCTSASPSAITLTGASVGGSATTGAWSIISGGGTLSSTAQTATPATVTYTPAANFSGTVTLRLTSNFGTGCSAATSDRTINVNAPTVTPGATLTACQSASPAAITLTGASFGGSATTAAWSIVSGGGTLSSTVQTATPATVTYTPAANFSGTVTLALTTNIPAGCSAATANRTITVNATPTVTPGATLTACQSASPAAITLTGASFGGSATTAAWSIVSGGGTLSSTAQTATPATVTYTPAANFSGTVTLALTTNIPSGCSAASANRTITVNAASTANAAGPNTVCESPSPSAITLTGATFGGGATTAAWSIFSGAGTLSSTAQTASPQTVTYTPAANASGTVTLRLTTNSLTGCNAVTSDRTITINAIPTATAGAALNACQSASPAAITLTGSSVGGSATTGAWSIISGGGTLSSTAQTATPATVTYTPAANFSGAVTLRLTSNAGVGCSAATSDRTINVNTTPTATAGGPNNVCQSASPVAFALSGASVGGSATTGAWSIISGGGTLSSTAQTGSPSTVTYTPAANFSGTVTLRLTSNAGVGCNAATSDRTVNVNALPTATAGGPNSACETPSPVAITLTGASVGGSATTGAWSIVSGGGVLSSTAQTASPQTVTYTPPANTSGTVTLRLTSNFGTGCSAATSDRTINLTAAFVNAGSNNTVCQSASPSAITLTGATFGGSATSAAWSIFSGGGTLSSTAQTANPATVTYTPAANFTGTVTLRLTTNSPAGCTNSNSDRFIFVTAASTANAGGPNNVCQSASPVAVALTGASVGGGATTGAWSIISGGGTLSSTAQTATPATVTYTPAANFSGTVTLRLTTNAGAGCNAVTSDRTFNVNAIATATAGGPNTVCQSASPVAFSLTGASVGGSATTGAWSIISGGGALSSTAQTASPQNVTYTPAANFSGTVTLRLTSNAGAGCTVATNDRTITVNPNPTATAGATLTACPSASPTAITLIGASVGNGATTGAWSIISGGGALSSTAQTATPATVTYTPAANFSGTVTLRLTTNNVSGCSAGTSDRTIVIQSPTATAGATLNTCQSAAPSAITLTGASVGGSATTGAWSIISGGGTLSSTAQTATPATVTYTPAANFTGTVTLRLTSNAPGGCTGAQSNRTINVNAKPTPAITGTLTICSGGSTTLDAGVFTSYIWSTSAVTQTINVNAAGTYTVTVTNANGCTGSTSATVTVSGSCNVTLNLKAMIEGYYRGGGQMDSVLVNGGQGGSSTVADSITIELHDPNSPATIVATKKVALLRNGMAQALFPAAISGGTYYIAVKGRTFIETWSKNPVTFTAITNFNFTP